MKRLKILILSSMIFCLASLAIIFVPNMQTKTVSMEIVPQISEYVGEVEENSTERNWGAVPRRRNVLDEEYLMYAKSINAESLPSSYNLTNDIDIEVKNQEQYGICYSFASLSALETTIAKTYGEYYNFSEIYVPYANDLSKGKSTISLNGGNFEDAVYVAEMSGLALEAEMPYPTFSGNGTNPTITNDYGTKNYQGVGLYTYSGLTTAQKTAIQNVSKTVEVINGAFYFPSSTSDTTGRRNAIKSHIYNYGAVYADFHVKSNQTEFNQYLNSYGAYEYNGSEGINHAITLVGWDDPKGAYIALNSWGTSWGNGGYFYVSYNDAYIEKGVCGFIPEGIKFNKDQDSIRFANDGTYSGYYATINTSTVVNVMKNTTGSTIYVDKIYLPLMMNNEKISLSYSILSSFTANRVKNATYTSILKDVLAGNSYFSNSSSVYVDYCIELETPIELTSGNGLALKFNTNSDEMTVQSYTSSTNVLTYCYYSTYEQQPAFDNDGNSIGYWYFDIQLGYKTKEIGYELKAGTLNDSVTSNYIDYFPNNGGAIYIPIGVEDKSRSATSYNVQIQKITRLTKENISSGYDVKHSSVNPNFDSDNDETMDMQNIYIEFSSKPTVGSYVANVSYGETSINKYFEVATTSNNVTPYTITYNLNGATINDNPTKFYAGWENVILNDIASATGEFEGWTSGGDQIIEIQTNGGNVEVSANFEGASLDAELSVEVENQTFTYDGAEHTITCNILNEYPENSYIEQRVEWFKGDSTQACATGTNLTVKNVADSGTYRCVVTLIDGLGNEVDNAETQATLTINKKSFSFYPTASYSKGYNEADPEFSYGFEGNVAGETPNFSGALSRESGETLGTYLITTGTLEVVGSATFNVSNYEISFTNTANKYLEITKAILRVLIYSNKGEGNQTITYGDSEPVVNLRVIDGLKTGENAVFAGEISRQSGNNVGTYRYTIDNVYLDSTNGTARAENYEISLGTTNLIIEQRQVNLILKIDDVTRDSVSYNGAEKTASIVIDNVVNGDSVTLSTTNSTFKATNVGTYTINITGLSNGNYKLPSGLSQITWRITKVATEVPQPTLLAIYGDKLNSIELPDGWEWDTAIYNNNTFVGNVGTNSFYAIYTPEDTINYETLREEFSVTVGPKTLYIVPNGNVVRKLSQQDKIITYFTFEGQLDGEVPQYTGALSRESGTTAGSYDFVLDENLLTLVDDPSTSFYASNYTLELKETSYKYYIGAISLTITEDQVKSVYDGTSLTIKVETKSSTYPNGFFDEEVFVWYKILTGGTEQEISNMEQLNLKDVADSGTYKCYYIVYRDSTPVDSVSVETSVSIGCRDLTISPKQSYEKEYGEADPEFEFVYSGNLENEIPAFSGTFLRESGESVGEYLINGHNFDLRDNEEFKASNYNLVVTNGNGYNLTIDKTTLLLQVKSTQGFGNQTKTYGEDDPVVELEVLSGLKVGETIKFNSNNPVSREVGEDVGEYAYSIQGLALVVDNVNSANPQNYNLELSPAKLTIEQRELILTLFNKATNSLYTTNFVYDTTEKEVFIKLDNNINGDNIELIYSEGSKLKAENAGEYTIVVDSVDNENYKLPANNTFTWEIAKATPVFELPNPTATYGDKLLSIELSNFEWDSSYTEEALVGDAGSRRFNATYIPDDADNYETVAVSIQVQVIPKELTITPDADQYKIYNGSSGVQNVLTFTIDQNDLVGEEQAKTSGQLIRDDNNNKNVGKYEIMQGSLTLVDNGDFKASNYQIKFVSDIEYEIKPREISLTFENYENLIYDGTTKIVVVNFTNKVLNDDVQIVFKNDLWTDGGVNTISTNTDGNICAINMGQYDIEIDSLLGEDSGNYCYPEELNLSFTIGKAQIVIVPNANQGKIYGEQDGEIKYTYTGAKNGEIPAFTGTLVRTAGESIGTYRISLSSDFDFDEENCENFIASNYTIVLDSSKAYYFVIKQRVISLKITSGIGVIEKTFDNTAVYNSSEILFGTHFVAEENCILETDLGKISISVSSAIYNSKFVLDAKKLTVSGFEIVGDAEVIKNYVLDNDISSLEFNGKINPKEYYIIGTNTIREFDGTNIFWLDFTESAYIDSQSGSEVKLENNRVAVELKSANVGAYIYSNTGDMAFVMPTLIDKAGLGFETNFEINVQDFTINIIEKEVENDEIVWVKGDKTNVIEESSFVYNGEDQENLVKAYFEGFNDEIIWLEVSRVQGEDLFVDAGTYSFELSENNSNYKFANNVANKQITIQKKIVTILLNGTQISFEKTYDANNYINIDNCSLDGVVGLEDVELINKPTKLMAEYASVGTYSFEANTLSFDTTPGISGTDAINYQLGELNYSLKINQRKITAENISWFLDGKSITVASNSLELAYNGVSYASILSAQFEYEYSSYLLNLETIAGDSAIKEVGTYTVRVTSALGENVGIDENTVMSIDIHIVKKDLYINLLTENKVYDGTNIVSITSYNINGTALGDEISINEANLMLTTENKNVGNNLTVIVNGNTTKELGILEALILGDNTSLSNYNVMVNAPNINISQKEVRTIWGSAELVYNGVLQVPSYTLSGLIDGDVCVGDLDGHQKEVPTTGGDPYIANIRSINNPNYKLSTENTSIPFTIIPVKIKIKTSDTETPEGKQPNYSYEVLEGAVYEGDDLHISYSLQETDEEFKYLILAEAFNRNYDIEFEYGTLTEIPVSRTFVVIVIGFIVGFFVLEVIIIRVKAIKKEKSKPTLKKAEGEDNGNIK